MDSPLPENISLASIPVTRRLLQRLFSENLISPRAKTYAEKLLALQEKQQDQNWLPWLSRLFLTFGIALLCAGIIYFFAFNWAKLPPLMKLGLIEMGLLISLIAAYIYNIEKFMGKILLLTSAIFVGVFLGVFGQVYQTGVDSYHLFLTWAVLIFPWVCISEFAGLWLTWIIISDIAWILLYWTHIATPDESITPMFLYLTLFHGFFLAPREYLSHQKFAWLKSLWTRKILVFAVLASIFIPAFLFIDHPHAANTAMIIGAIGALIIHAGFYFIYRYKRPDFSALALTLGSACILADWSIFSALSTIRFHPPEVDFLLTGIATLALFAFYVRSLNSLATKLKALQEQTKEQINECA